MPLNQSNSNSSCRSNNNNSELNWITLNGCLLQNPTQVAASENKGKQPINETLAVHNDADDANVDEGEDDCDADDENWRHRVN